MTKPLGLHRDHIQGQTLKLYNRFVWKRKKVLDNKFQKNKVINGTNSLMSSRHYSQL